MILFSFIFPCPLSAVFHYRQLGTKNISGSGGSGKRWYGSDKITIPYASLQKSSKNLVRRYLEPLKAFLRRCVFGVQRSTHAVFCKSRDTYRIVYLAAHEILVSSS